MSETPIKRIHARTVLALDLNKVWSSLAGNFDLVFDNGDVIHTNHKETIYTRYFWEFFKAYPAVVITKKHHVSAVLRGSRLSMKTHMQLIENILWDCADYLALTNNMNEMVERRFELAKLAYSITNQHYNDFTVNLEEYVTSLNILDFLEVFDHPDLVQAYREGSPDEQTIRNIYGVIDDILQGDVSLLNNNISKLHRSSLISKKQAEQCLGPRGYVTNAANYRYGVPVMRGYFQTIRSQRDIQIESGTLTKALDATKGQLQQTEYFSRKLRLQGMGVERLHYEDCGSTRYLNHTIRGKTEDSPGDLGIFEGKYYVDEADNNKLKAIGKTDYFLIGKKLNIRTALACSHTDPNGVCSVCYGMMSELIPRGSNLGHANCTHVTEINTQQVMSTKHLDSTSSIRGVDIDSSYAKYIKTTPDKNSFLLADELKPYAKAGKLFLRIAADTALSLDDIFLADNVSSLVESRMSTIDDIVIQTADDGITIPVRDGKRPAYLTYEFLEYVKKTGYKVDQETGEYVFDMSGWKPTVAFLSLPMQQFNASDHSKDISQVLESSVEEMVTRDRLLDPTVTLVELTDLINSRSHVNIAVVEITLLSAMIRSAETYEYAIPKTWTQSGLGVMKYTILHRSLSAYMAYEHHGLAIYSPASYVLKNRPEHPMDPILLPAEVLPVRFADALNWPNARSTTEAL